MAQIPTFGTFQKPEQDLMILIKLFKQSNLFLAGKLCGSNFQIFSSLTKPYSPHILGLLRLYFPLSREKVMVEPGTVSARLGRLL